MSFEHWESFVKETIKQLEKGKGRRKRDERGHRSQKGIQEGMESTEPGQSEEASKNILGEEGGAGRR